MIKKSKKTTSRASNTVNRLILETERQINNRNQNAPKRAQCVYYQKVELRALHNSRGRSLFVHIKNKKTGELRAAVSNEVVKPPETAILALSISGFETDEAGVSLNVTPVLKSDGRTIILDFDAQVRELVDWIDYGSGLQNVDGEIKDIKMLLPVFTSRRLMSSITLENGETAVMGGLVSENKETDIERIPVLSRIPLLGRLFRKERAVRTRTESFVLITASVVSEQ